MKIVFFGSSSYVLSIIDSLRVRFDLVLIVTTEHDPSDPLAAYCKTHAIPITSRKRFSEEFINKLASLNAGIGVLASFGLIVPEHVLTIFPKGIINIHPSYLPAYRGPTPAQTAILNGDSQTGVSIIKLDNKLDHGPLLAQAKENILPTDTAESLYIRLFHKGAALLTASLQTYMTGILTLREQDHEHATYTNILQRESGYIDLENPPTKEIVARMIRAFHPWPGAWTKLNTRNNTLKIVKFLPDQKIQMEGKKPVHLKDFFNGYPEFKDAISRLF